MSEPKTCPFCDSKPVIHRHTARAPRWFVVECVSAACDNRKVSTSQCGDEAEAIRIWNDRHA